MKTLVYIAIVMMLIWKVAQCHALIVDMLAS